MIVCVQNLATSLAQIFIGEEKSLDLPLSNLPLDMNRNGSGFFTEMLSGYRIMWMLVMFDLPVVSKRERKDATKFRNALLDMGFEMSQFSVYMRFCTSSTQVETYCRKVREHLPKGGRVNILQFTDKQYEKIIAYQGQAKLAYKKTPDQFDLF